MYACEEMEMSKESEPLRKIESEMRISERIMSLIPGFRGYKQKELRRESDRLVRNRVYEKLQEAAQDLREVYRELVDRGFVGMWEGVDRLAAKFDHISEKINHASYGYSGFFDAIKVDEEKLDQLIRFDLGLVTEADALASTISQIKRDASSGSAETLRTEIQNILSSANEFEKHFSQRKTAILESLEGS